MPFLDLLKIRFSNQNILKLDYILGFGNNMGIKNLVGDYLGYGRCQVTNDTFWNANLICIPYSETREVIVSDRALLTNSNEEIARKVIEISREWPTATRRYSLDEIASMIPNKCVYMPRNRLMRIKGPSQKKGMCEAQR